MPDAQLARPHDRRRRWRPGSTRPRSATRGAPRSSRRRPGSLTYALYAHTDDGAPERPSVRDAAGEQVVERHRRAAAEHVDAPDDDLGRHDATALRPATQVASRRRRRDARQRRGPLASAATTSGRSGSSGSIDDVRVYNRALTAAEVAADMATPVACVSGPPPPPQPVLSVSKSTMSFTATQGGSDPAAQTVGHHQHGHGHPGLDGLRVQPVAVGLPGERQRPVDPDRHAVDRRPRARHVHDERDRGRRRRHGLAQDDRRVPARRPAATSARARGLGHEPELQRRGRRRQPGRADGDVTNTGGGTLSFTASDDQSWLSVTPGSGSAPATLSVSVNTAGLAAGDLQRHRDRRRRPARPARRRRSPSRSPSPRRPRPR